MINDSSNVNNFFYTVDFDRDAFLFDLSINNEVWKDWQTAKMTTSVWRVPHFGHTHGTVVVIHALNIPLFPSLLWICHICRLSFSTLLILYSWIHIVFIICLHRLSNIMSEPVLPLSFLNFYVRYYMIFHCLSTRNHIVTEFLNTSYYHVLKALHAHRP